MQGVGQPRHGTGARPGPPEPPPGRRRCAAPRRPRARGGTLPRADGARDRPGDDRDDLPRLRRRRRARRARLPRVHPALPAARAGSSTTRRRSGTSRSAVARRGARRRRRRPRRARGDRDHQPARDGLRLGPRDGRAAAPRARLAGPAHRRALRRAARRTGTRRWCASAPGSSSTRTSPATKIEWLLEHVDGLRERAEPGARCSARSTRWLVFKLTGEHVTDRPNASRTLLYDIGRGAWDDELLRAVRRAARARCPRCARRSASSARRAPERAATATTVPVAGIAGDQQAALFGQACLDPGRARTPTAPARSCCSTAAATPPVAAAGAAGDRRLGDRGAHASTRSRRRSSSPARRCSGCATGSGSSSEAAETEALAALAGRPTTASTSCPR